MTSRSELTLTIRSSILSIFVKYGFKLSNWADIFGRTSWTIALKYSKYNLLNVEMIECPRAAKTSPGTISFQWFIPEAVNMYSYSCLLINCHNVIIISIFYNYYQKYPTKGVNLSSSHVQLFGFHDLWIISSDGCPIPLSTRVYKISSGSLWISKLFEFVVDWSII